MTAKTRTTHSSKKSLKNEVLAVLLAAAAVLLLLSLVTYNPLDPSWNSVSSRQEPSNLIGMVGAYVGDLFLQLFGLASFIVPALIVFIAWRMFFSDQARVPVIKVVGSVLLLFAFSGFLSLFPKVGVSTLEHISSNGGAVGYVLSEQLVSLLNSMGAAIVLAVASVLTLILTMEISLASLVGRISMKNTERADARKGAPKLIDRVKTWIGLRMEQYRTRKESERAAKAEAARQAQEALNPPAREPALHQPQASRRAVERTLQPSEERKPLRPDPVIGSQTKVEDVQIVVQPAAVENGARAVEKVGGEAYKNGTPPEEVRVAQAESVPEVSNTRREMAAVLKARAAKAEQGRAASHLAPDEITMDPDVAEMTSTAWIDRTVSSDEPPATGVKEQPARKKSVVTLSGAKYQMPSHDLLETPIGHHEQAEEELRGRATILAEKCKEFGVTGHIHRINPGPVVTTFEFKPDPGIKYSRIVSLSDDLCLALQADAIRIDRIPGKSTVGIEVPNLRREKIYLREVIGSPRFQQSDSKLTVALGKTINGDEYITDLTKMPHLLIAGATGAGKSVTLNTIVCSILYKASPDEVKFIMVDPKRVELGLYENIPHLLTPIVTDPKRAANALKWAVNEMESRYRKLASLGVRNIDQYNRELREASRPNPSSDDAEPDSPLPYIVIAIDELADLMMIARSEVETSIARLAQMARAVGIHLVLATQRPSVDIITGVIKANIPSRIAFRVSQKVDSRTIIDANGAESLLGQGDMLFLPPGSARLIRVHGSFVNENEIKAITDHTRKQAEPQYNEHVTLSEQEAEETGGFTGERDELYDEALVIVTDMGRASTSVLQRRLSIGYGRAAKILDVMEHEGFIGPADGAKPRKVLQTAFEYRERLEQQRLEHEIE
jgi:S-DNA-T family DNA segregation ATPase FtsK/SpoIIIE